MANPKTKIEITAVDKTKAAFASVNRSIGKTDKAMGSLMSTLGSAAAVGALARMVVKTAEFGDKIDKLSTRLGVTSKFLTEMRYASESAGVGFDTFTMALQRMERRLGQLAATGKGEALPALELLGMTIGDLETLGAEQQFYKLAEAISKVENPQKRLFIAMKLFDSEGVRLVQMMEDGADGLEEWADRAADLGVVMDNVASQEMANFKQATTDLGMAFEGLGVQLTTTFGPAVTDMINGVTSAVVALGGAASSTMDFLKAISLYSHFEPIYMEGYGPDGKLPDTPDVPYSPPSIGRSSGGGGSKRSSGKSEAQQLAEDFDRLRESLFPLVKLENDYYKNMVLIEQAMDAAGGTSRVYSEAMAELTKQFEEAEKKLNNVESGVIEWDRLMSDALGNFAADFSDYFVDSIMEGKFEFDDFVKNFVAGMAKMIIHAQMLNMMKTAFPSLAPLMSAKGNAFDGGNVIPFASGGIVDKPTLFPMASGVGLMGEAGPDAVMPLKRGSDGKLGVAASGGGGININIQNYGNNEVRAQESSDGRSIDIVIEEKMKEINASGRMDSSMAANWGMVRRGY